MRKRAKPKSITMDFGDGEITGSTIEDVYTEADDALVARGGVHDSKVRRFLHPRSHRSRAVLLWTAVGALAAIIVPILIAVLS